MRFLFAALFAALALVAAGCGGGGAGSDAGAASATESGATVLRSGTLLFASLNTDLESAEWEQVRALLDRFPGRSRLLALLRKELRDEGINFERDVRPVLGPELDLAVIEVPRGADSESVKDDPPVVALHQPKDERLFEALLRKAEDPPVFRRVDGWYVIADTQAAIDRALPAAGGGTLSGESRFTAAMAKLDDETVAKLYVNGEEALRAVRAAGADSLGAAGTAQLMRLIAGAGAVTAEDEGLRIEGFVERKPAAAGDVDEVRAPSYRAELLGRVPAGALMYLSFGGYRGDPAKILRQAGLGQLRMIERALGVTFAELAPLFRNEGALYVRPGTPIPEITLLLGPENRAAALATLDRLAARAVALDGVDQGQPQSIDGISAKSIEISGFSILYGATGEQVFVTNSLRGIRALNDSGDKLADDADFKEALEAAEMPEETTGFMYVNLEESIPLVQDLARLGDNDIPREVSENLEPLRSLLLWGTDDGETSRFAAFLRVE